MALILRIIDVHTNTLTKLVWNFCRRKLWTFLPRYIFQGYKTEEEHGSVTQFCNYNHTAYTGSTTYVSDESMRRETFEKHQDNPMCVQLQEHNGWQG